MIWPLALAAALIAGCATQEAVTEQEPVPTYSIEQFLDTTNVFGGSFSPDGTKILVASDESGIYNAYSIPVAGGQPTALTESTDQSVLYPRYFPSDERFTYEGDQGGDELDHVYVRELDGTIVDLTPGEGHKAGFEQWAHDDSGFYVTTNERDSRFFDLYKYDAGSYERELVYENDEGYQIAGVSPDERHLVLSKTVTNTDNDLYLHDLESGTTEHLTPHEGEVAHSFEDFSPLDGALWYTTDEGSEFAYLVRREVGGERETRLQPDWDVSYAYFSKGGKYLVVGVNADARTVVRLFDGATMEEIPLPEMADADISSIRISDDESLMSFYASTSRTPRNLHVYDFSGEAPRRLTQTLNPAIDPDHLVAAEVVRFASFDGMEIPGLLYRPKNASGDDPVPAVISVHGGPGGQSRIGYSALTQYLVNHGYAVYAINNRGSSGYGKTFYKADDRKHGDEDLDDCVSSKRMLVDTGWIDPERIGIMGGSYGGYMVLAALTFRPEEFAVGVDIFGISNWVRTMESIPPYWEAFRKALIVEIGDPVADREYIESISPLFHAENIVRPLMVLQGANDPRVIQPESDDIVAAVKANGVPVEYLVFEDEGHGFLKRENKLEAYAGIREFLDTYLAGGTGEAQPEA
jgi:dipeptidyl aminopeptidase/acylaminoacyl peptidase